MLKVQLEHPREAFTTPVKHKHTHSKKKMKKETKISEVKISSMIISVDHIIHIQAFFTVHRVKKIWHIGQGQCLVHSSHTLNLYIIQLVLEK